jgi:hypothetical protein
VDEDLKKKVESGKDWLAARRAWLDQRREQFERQYDSKSPAINRARLDDLERWEFVYEINKWDIEGYIKNWEEEKE